MLKRFVSSCLVILMLAGCGSSSTAASSANPSAAASASSSASAEADNSADMEAAASQAAQAVKDLGLSDSIQAVEPQVVQGLMFFDEGLVTGSSLYLSGDKKADLVGVFKTSDPDAAEENIKTYLSTLKDQMQNYNPSEVFKIDNAVIENNDSEVVVIVNDDIEAAKKEAAKLLGK